MVDQEREELYNTIWNLADKLRGSIEGWEFKNYILGFLFYRYISEDFSNYVKSRVNAGEDFDYASRKDDEPWIEGLKDDLIEDKGYFIPPSHLFKNVLKKITSGDPEHTEFRNNLNERIREIFAGIEGSTHGTESKDDFNGLFHMINLSNVKLGEEVIQRNKKLADIIIGIEKMNVPSLKDCDSDVFGDAYEYLIRMYASKAGKSGGEFYTPPEVSRLLVDLVTEGKIQSIRKVYDPTCGSGSLLLKFLKKGFDKPENLQFFGQEINRTTYDLCRMNMFLHGINYSRFDIKWGDTLKNDMFKSWKFDAIVSNPPYSIEWDGKDDINLRNDERFAPSGSLAPKKFADLAFIQHSLHHLSNDGIAAIVCFPGILYRRAAEKDIRKWLIEGNYVDAIIQLTDKLFYGTPIATCIMVLKKSKQTSDVMFIDASTIFTKVTKRNRLDDKDLERIMQLYRDRKDVDEYVKVASIDEIKEKEYKLSIDSYVIKKDEEETIDLDALDAEIKERTIRIDELRQKIDDLIKQARGERDVKIKEE